MRYTDSMKQELNRRVAACAAGFALPRYSDLPQVGLYLDQTVQFINGYFRDFPGVELTPSMVSNYVKKGIISHPVKKKYTREQLASLMYIAVSKTVLSMENIDALFQMQRAHCTAEEAYNYFCDEMENCLPFVFGARNTIRDLAVDATTEKWLLRSTILAAANKMYLDCFFAAQRQEEALWPDILADLTYKEFCSCANCRSGGYTATSKGTIIWWRGSPTIPRLGPRLSFTASFTATAGSGSARWRCF